MQVCRLLLELAVCSYSNNRAIYKVYWPYSWFSKTQVVPLYGKAVAQLGGRLEKIQITWHHSLLLHCQGVHLHQAADTHTTHFTISEAPCDFIGHETMPVRKQISIANF